MTARTRSTPPRYGIDEYCGRTFTQDATGATVARRFTWQGGPSILIDDLITAATVQTDWNGDGTFETTWVADTNYQLEPFNAALWGKPYERLGMAPLSSVCFPPWNGGVKVIGQWGWPSVPAPVKQATTIMTTRLLRRAREAPFGVVGLGIDNQAVRISKVDPDLCFLLDQFVKGNGVLGGMSATAAEIRQGLADALATISGLQAFPYLLANPTPPCAMVLRGLINYDEAFEGGTHLWEWLIRVYVANVSDIGAAMLLDQYLAADGAKSVKEAIEANSTLNGTVADLHVTEATGEQVFVRDSGGPLLGSEWTVQVWL